MPGQSAKTRMAKTSVVVMSMLVVALLLAPGVPRAAAADGQTVTATPSSGLSDGQFVNLSFSGWTPYRGILLRQCIAAVVNPDTDCTAVNTQVFPVADANGAAVTFMPVFAGNDDGLKNSGGTGSIVCNSTHPCAIRAESRSAASVPIFASVPITFQPSPDDCPPPPADALLGGGSSSAYRAIYGWQTQVCVPPANLSVGYTVRNSFDGVANFLNGTADFAVTGPSQNPPTAPPGTPAPTYKLAPVTTSAVTLGYRIFDELDSGRGPQITTLTLTPELVAKIFTERDLDNWDASNVPDAKKIEDLNPGLVFPRRMHVFARAEHSAQTFAFTSWLAATAPDAWKDPTTGAAIGPQETFPASLPAVGVTGNVGPKVQDPAQDDAHEGSIGFMDSSTAAFYGLPTVRIKRADGSVVAATPDTISKAISDATANPDGTITPNYATTDSSAYPVPMPAYLMAPTNTIAAGRGASLAAFLRYAVQDGQSHLPPGYAPLPKSMVDRSLQVAGDIPGGTPAPPQSTPAPSTGTSAAPSPSPGPGAGSGPGSGPGPDAGTGSGSGSASDSGAGAGAGLAPPSPQALPLGSPPSAPVRAVAPRPSVTPAAVVPSPHPTACRSAASCSPASQAVRRGRPIPTIPLVADVARLILPWMVVTALICLLIGPALQALVRRRISGAARTERRAFAFTGLGAAARGILARLTVDLPERS